MRRTSILVGLAAIAVAFACYWFLSGSGSKSPKSRGKSAASTRAAKPRRRRGRPPKVAETTPLHGNMGGGMLAPSTDPKVVPASMAARRPSGPKALARKDLGISLEKPDAPEWVMTDRPELFMIPDKGKVAELHRNGGRADPRFATVYVYVLQAPGTGDGAQQVAALERLDKKAPASEFEVLGEERVKVAGMPMIRRVTLWKAEGRATKFLSVRCVRDGRLYVLLAFTDPTTFDDFLPDFEKIIASLKIG